MVRLRIGDRALLACGGRTVTSGVHRKAGQKCHAESPREKPFDIAADRWLGNAPIHLFSEAMRPVAKPELGTKRVCPSCGTKYFDLKRDPITCPNCGTVFVLAARDRLPPKEEKKPKVVEKEAVAVADDEEEESEDVEIIALEDAEAPDTDAEADDAVESDEVVLPDADADADEEIEADEDDTFIAEEDEEGDDVSGLLDVEAEDDDT